MAINLYSKDSVDALLADKLDNPVGPAGITFNDSTVQTTAATGTNYGDLFGFAIVKDVSWSGSAWVLTCAPVNNFLGASGGPAVVNTTSSLFEWMSGMSSTSTWTYTTTTFGVGDYIYIQCLSQVSTQPVNLP